MKTTFKTISTSFIALFISVSVFAQSPERNIGLSVALKHKPGMAYEYDQALAYYTKTFRTDSAYAVRVTRVTAGQRAGYDLLGEPLKTWTEMDAVRPYQSDASARAWQNVLKYCEDIQMNYFYYDTKNSNPLPKSNASTKYVSYVWVIEPKADEDAFAAEFKKAAAVLKKAGYRFAMTRSLSGDVRYQIQMQLENGWKEMDKKMPEYKELYQKAYPANGAWEKHNGILQSATQDFFVEYRSIRNSVSTR